MNSQSNLYKELFGNLELEFYKQVLIEAISKHKIKVTIENLKIENPNTLVEKTSYQTIQRIRKILANETLSDFECIERITNLLENIGSDASSRHDFN